MELKPLNDLHKPALDGLLIVPYGIETWEQMEAQKELAKLLIVPYGIETTQQRIG